MPMYFDASTVFRAGMGPTTGIPRYERQIIRAALNQRTDEIGICCFDRKRNILRKLTPRELGVLEDIMSADKLAAAKGLGTWKRFLWARSVIAKNALGSSREFERSAAFVLAGHDQRSGLRYGLSKTTLRLGRVLDVAVLRDRTAAFDLLTDGDARIFLSNQTIPLAARRLDQGNISARLYPVMYDMVALDTPHYTTASVRDKFLPSFRRAAAVSSGMICISKHTRDRVSYWCRKLGAGATPVFSVDSSSDLVEQDTIDTPVPGLAGQRFVLYCSTIEPRKNHLLPLAIWKEKANSGVRDMPLIVFCGKKGWSYEGVFGFLRENPSLHGLVVFLHGISDSGLVWLYRNALFSIFPSFEEGWGLGASESLDFGTPVVISEAPALREATQGLMPTIDAADIGAWSSKIDELAGCPSALDELRGRISEHYRRTPVKETFRQILDCMSR